MAMSFMMAMAKLLVMVILVLEVSRQAIGYINTCVQVFIDFEFSIKSSIHKLKDLYQPNILQT